MAIARRWAPGRTRLIRLVPVHLLLGVAIALLHTVLSHLLYKLLLAPEVSWTEFARNFASSALMTGPTRISTYLEIVGITWGLDYYRGYREREVRASILQTQVAEARLEALKLQLRPAFVFNALNTILPLIYRNAQAAARTVVQLGDLLRLSLKSGATQLVPLQEELHFLELYLQIEKTRLADRLTVTFEIDPQASSAGVPNLILQPIVENAVSRGRAARRAGATSASPRAAPGTRCGSRSRTTQPWRPQTRPCGSRWRPTSPRPAAASITCTRTRTGVRSCPIPEGGQQVVLSLPYSPAPVSERVAVRAPARRAPAAAPPAPEGAGS